MNADDALLKAARGHDPQQRSTDQSLLPCFALKAHHIASSIDTPSDFHAFLCHAIRKAKHRILLASLYIGPAVGDDAAHEKELLMALQEACMKSEPYHRPTVQILLDASRGLRPVGGTCSAQAVYNHISPTHTNSSISSSKVYLFPALHSFLRSYIPSPLDEVAGVFHIKAYIIDDQLILTGANLSQEYFTDRQDRYIVFDQGANGLVDFYAQLFDILSNYAIEYKHEQSYNHPNPTHFHDTLTRREHLAQALSTLFQGGCNTIRPTSHDMHGNVNIQVKGAEDKEEEDDDAIVAYAVPTFQAPGGFFPNRLSFPSDTTVIQKWLQVALQQDSSSTIRLSSAYLNPTPSLLSVLTQFGYYNDLNQARQEKDDEADKEYSIRTNGGKAILLTAGTASHGFAPKKNKRSLGKDRSWIPTAFHHILDDISSFIIPRGGIIILYERPGWTFHVKGIWLTTMEDHHDMKNPHCTFGIAKPESTLLGTVVGSSNFGFRSEKLDFESNTLLLMNRQTTPNQRMKTAQLLVRDWNSLCHHVTPFQSNKLSPKTKPESLSVYYKNRMKRLGLRAVIRLGKIFF